MLSNYPLLNIIRYFCSTVLVIGVLFFLAGIYGSGPDAFTGIGIGTAGMAVFIFLMGVLFTIAEEMLEKTREEREVSVQSEFVSGHNVIPFPENRRRS